MTTPLLPCIVRPRLDKTFPCQTVTAICLRRSITTLINVVRTGAFVVCELCVGGSIMSRVYGAPPALPCSPVAAHWQQSVTEVRHRVTPVRVARGQLQTSGRNLMSTPRVLT